jgi:ubiquinone biosynthesis monooxygenase Coq7
MTTRQYSPFDRFIQGLDQALHTILGPAPEPSRPNPAAAQPDAELSSGERELAGRLMRVNHAGEISAQALYQGQALTARLPTVRDKMEQAATEENDHLAWTEQRIRELGTHTTVLAPLWYAGSFAIGALAGVAGDKWSLGFVAETEHQVIRHLDAHLARLPERDAKSRAILEQMRDDEARHATTALAAGGAALPEPVRQLMALTSKTMTTTAYWL